VRQPPIPVRLHQPPRLLKSCFLGHPRGNLALPCVFFLLALHGRQPILQVEGLVAPM
jgi:hypothetical protein